MVTVWAKKKYTAFQEHGSKYIREAFVNAVKFEVEQEKGSDGSCDTCWSEYAYLAVYAVDEKGRHIEIDEIRHASLVDILAEILEANGS
jgi:hypothetical protein